MAEYYFDIEVYSKGELNPDIDKIITLQYQRIDLGACEPRGPLTILKEWESSEEKIVVQFYDLFFKNKKKWDFVPVGFNLNFEWEFLIAKFAKYLDKRYSSRELHYDRPHLDLKPIAVIKNNGNFKGASLANMTKKPDHGGLVKEWYENAEYAKIEAYINEETSEFLKFLKNTASELRR